MVPYHRSVFDSSRPWEVVQVPIHRLRAIVPRPSPIPRPHGVRREKLSALDCHKPRPTGLEGYGSDVAADDVRNNGFVIHTVPVKALLCPSF